VYNEIEYISRHGIIASH